MKKILFLLLLFVISVSVSAQITFQGSEPQNGNTYYLWNVGRQSFLCLNDSKLALSGRPLAFTVDGAGATFTLTTAEGLLGSSLYGIPSVGSPDNQHEWSAVSMEKGYVLSVRLPESADFHPLYFSEAFGDVRTMMQQPDDEFTDALWRFVSPNEASVAEVTLDETADSYTVPVILNTATVKLKRSFTLNNWNTLCVPFDIPASQLKEQFGDDVKLATLSGSNDTQLFFSLTDAVEKGKPYLVRPTKESTDGRYVFTGVGTFAEAPQEVVRGTARFHGSFCKTPVPAKSYVIRKNEVYHLPESMTTKGFRCWIEDTEALAHFTSWQIDGTTGIMDVSVESVPEVYDLSGRHRCGNAGQASKMTTLPHGVYIIKGKKIIK